MSTTDKIITDMFKKYWRGDETLSSIDNMRKQLRKSLNDQVNGFWSGRSAYCIMVEGGFLVDEKFKGGKGKRLTAFGEAFVKEFDNRPEKNHRNL